MITAARLAALALALAACTPAAPAWPPPNRAAPGPYHDPDHLRGPLPGEAARRAELRVVRADLDAMYAHRADKLARDHLDEDALFARAEQALVAASSWAAYDDALYDLCAAFHDDHLTYHPPPTAAPRRGYRGYRFGFTTVLASGRLLVATVEPALARSIAPGDEVIAIDGRPIADVLAAAIAHRVWSRPESAQAGFARTWTSVLEPIGQAPRVHQVAFRRRTGGDVTLAIAPHPASGPAHPLTETRRIGGVPVVALRTLGGGSARARAIDDALAAVRDAPALVLDLRGDRGGVDLVGDRVVADLAEGRASLGSYRVKVAPATLALRPRWKDLVAEADGFSPPQPLAVDAQPPGKGFHGRLAVVVDAGCASTCEIVTAALRADLHALVVGETTAGASGAPVAVRLPASLGELEIPTWNLTAADGHAIEGDGIVPDVPVAPTPDALAAGVDLPLQTAVDRVSGAP